MKKIHGSNELYGEILKSFYFGEFQKNGRFMTQAETRELYGVSRSTVEKTFKRLQEEGFLTSQRRHGSIVTYDHNNPAHVAKVPLEHPDPAVRELHTYDFPPIMLARILYVGLCQANEERLASCQRGAQEILRCVERDENSSKLIKAWHIHIVEDLQNTFLTNILDHFFTRYLYLNSRWNMTPGNWRRMQERIEEFFQDVLQMLEERDFQRFVPLKKAYYRDLYQIPNAMLFAKVTDSKRFQESAQYGKVLYALLCNIQGKGLKRGDLLPTIAQLSQQYQVSAKTVRRAYGILAEIGLVEGKQRTGTRLIANPSDGNIKRWMEIRFLRQKSGLTQLCDGLVMISNSILQSTASRITSDLIQKMRKHLAGQNRGAVECHLPYLVTDAIVTPVVATMPAGVLHMYYFYLLKPVLEFVSLSGMEYGFALGSSEEVYQLACTALDALEEGDTKTFILRITQAQQLNKELLMGGLHPHSDPVEPPREGLAPLSDTMIV